MPIKTPRLTRGVLVDYQGYFLAAWQWEGAPPEFNKPRRGERLLRKEDKKHLLLDEAATADPQPNGRWDFKKKVWEKPQTKLWVVEEGTGKLRGSRMVFLEKVPPLGPGLEYVDVEPPSKRGRKPLWTGSEWCYPRKVEVIENDEVVAFCLENPREDQPDVEIKPGQEKRVIDDGN